MWSLSLSFSSNFGSSLSDFSRFMVGVQWRMSDRRRSVLFSGGRLLKINSLKLKNPKMSVNFSVA